jgi:hypothetical protein
LSDTESFSVQVNEVNNQPSLSPLAPATISEGQLFTLPNAASDTDMPAQQLSFSLDTGSPEGMTINASGEINWTPTEAQGPGNYPVTVRVTDNGEPPASTTQPLTVTVLEVNEPPVLEPIPDVTLVSGRTLHVTNVATDSDLPVQTFAFSLLSAPADATLDPLTGLLTWRPLIASSPVTNLLTVRVADNGTPGLSATQSFKVSALRPLSPSLTVTSSVSGQFSMLVFGDTGPDYIVEHATNNSFSGWLPVATNFAPATPFLWSESIPGGATQRVYRVRLAP